MARPRGSSTKQLTDANRKTILDLYHGGGFNVSVISARTSFTKAQIKRVLRTGQAERQAGSGRKPFMPPEDQQALEEYITSSREARRQNYHELAATLFEGRYGWSCIRETLYRLGFNRRVARRKPPLSEVNRTKRLAFAHAHAAWTKLQWDSILWTDETWVTGGTHRPVYVTRRRGEEYNDTCVVDAYRKKKGWMFWGSFSGFGGKGPCLF
jgi:transposase